MDEIQKNIANEINSLHNELVGLFRQSVHKAVKIGERLSEVKQSLPHGEFTGWMKDNISFTARTGRNYMKLYQNRDKVLQAGSISEAYQLLEPKTETVSDLNNDVSLIAISDIICKKEYHVRFGINYDVVKRYSEYVGELPAIEINQDNILIDGWHRLEAYKLLKREFIPYFRTEADDIKLLSAKRNSRHGLINDKPKTETVSDIEAIKKHLHSIGIKTLIPEKGDGIRLYSYSSTDDEIKKQGGFDILEIKHSEHEGYMNPEIYRVGSDFSYMEYNERGGIKIDSENRLISSYKNRFNFMDVM